MKQLKFFFLAAVAMLTAAFCTSCDKDDDPVDPTATYTVKVLLTYDGDADSTVTAATASLIVDKDSIV